METRIGHTASFRLRGILHNANDVLVCVEQLTLFLAEDLRARGGGGGGEGGGDVPPHFYSISLTHDSQAAEVCI